MNTLSTLAFGLGLLALTPGISPAAAMETAPRSPREAEPLHQLHIQTVNPEGADACFILEGLPHPLPPQGVEIFWSDEDRDQWVRIDGFFATPEGVVIQNPAPRGTALEFLILVRGKAWGRAFHEPAPGAIPGPAGADPALCGPEEEAAALALIQGLPEPAPAGPPEDSGQGEGEPGHAGTREPALDPDGTTPRDPAESCRHADARRHLLGILEAHGLSPSELAQWSETPHTTGPFLSRFVGPQPGDEAVSFTYPMAMILAHALNRANPTLRLREAPFTGDELYLGGQPPQALAGRALLRFILAKDRHDHGCLASEQADRLGIKQIKLYKLTCGELAILPTYITTLKTRLDLPTLGLTGEDLDRLACRRAYPYENHPGNRRTLALFHKATACLGLTTMHEFGERCQIKGYRLSEIRSGALKVTPSIARKLSDFHNRHFPQEPPTTPGYFQGK